MTIIGTVRSRVLTPAQSQTLMDVRGFNVKSDAARQRLEYVGATFLLGYAEAARARFVDDIEDRLEVVPEEYRGFAYEGAGMGFAIRDGIPLGSGRHFARFVSGPGRKHSYMAYIGLGWAMARLPRLRWSRIVVQDPLMRWLVLDGYGFHQAYFRTDAYVREHYQQLNFRWPGGTAGWYAHRAIDQGVGRALWFVGGTDVTEVCSLIESFPAHRQSDLWAGAGLAATYAGGAGTDELHQFAERSGRFRPQVAQGSCFAATARVEAGLVNEHTELATRILCGLTPQRAAALSAAIRPAPDADAEVPAYELWRCRLADELAVVPDPSTP